MANLIYSANDTVFARRESNVRSYVRSFPAAFKSGSGSMVQDEAGLTYIDFLAGCASLNYGHNDPDMKQALIDHICADGIAQGLDLATTTKRAFMEAFEGHILEPRGLDHRMQFTGPTGTNAIEAAIKLARKATGRTNIVAFTNGYHGVSLGALATTGNRHHRGGAGVPLSGVHRAPFEGYYGPGIDTVEMLARMLDDPSSGVDAPAAFLLETVQGEGGLNVASAGWTQALAALARRHGALLIIDEVQAGCGRAGTFFSFDSLGVVPDLVAMSKSLSGFGLPMSLLLIRPEHDVWRPAEHNGTFRGNNHAFVTARVAIEKFWSDGAFAAEIERKGELVAARLAEIGAVIPGSRVKGRGMMRGLDVGSGELAAEISRACYAEGLIIETAGAHDEVLKVLAPLTTPDDVLEAGLAIVERAVTSALAQPKAA